MCACVHECVCMCVCVRVYVCVRSCVCVCVLFLLLSPEPKLFHSYITLTKRVIFLILFLLIKKNKNTHRARFSRVLRAVLSPRETYCMLKAGRPVNKPFACTTFVELLC